MVPTIDPIALAGTGEPLIIDRKLPNATTSGSPCPDHRQRAAARSEVGSPSVIDFRKTELSRKAKAANLAHPK